MPQAKKNAANTPEGKALRYKKYTRSYDKNCMKYTTS
jgi:hypothetical protein